MLNFILYLKRRKPFFIILSAVALAIATYVRPVSYYMGFAVFFFILYASKDKEFKNCFKHALIFLLIVYSITGIWQIRNHIKCRDFAFSSAGRGNLYSKGLFKSYARNTDPHTKGMAPLPYYASV